MRTLRSSVIIGIILGASMGFLYHGIAYAVGILYSSGLYGGAHVFGVWDTRGGGGNGGMITLIPQSEESRVGGSGVYIDTDVYPPTITGSLFIETVGWARFIDTEIRDDLSISGNLWNDNAGYIELDARDTSYSGVYYLPGSQSFSGYAWSDALGYLSFGSGSNIFFRNKIKVIGTIGGDKVFDTDYVLGSKFVSAKSAPIFDTIRKNVGLLTRSAPPDKMNTADTTTNLLNNILYYKGNDMNSLIVNNPHTKLDSRNARTLIIEGGDLYITNDIPIDNQVNSPRAIIVMKSPSGLGGNVYISPAVKNIYTSLIVEGAIFSGDGPFSLTNNTTTKIVNLPTAQLYIYGGIYSRNTIGGAARGICPFNAVSCTENTKYQYDWNYFRSYDKTPGNRSSKPNYQTDYDNYSVIIEFDPRIYENPPPGMVY